MLFPSCAVYRVRYGIPFLIVRLTSVCEMSQLRAAKRVCKNPGTKAYFLTKSVNDVDRREWLYRDGAARKVLGDRDFVFGDELTRENLLKTPDGVHKPDRSTTVSTNSSQTVPNNCS